MMVRNLVGCALVIITGVMCSSLPQAAHHDEQIALPGRSGQGDLRDSLKCYLAQLHIHGHSNHNGNGLPASMESHLSEADRSGFDVVWWTDHAEIFRGYEDLRVDFRSAAMDSSGKAVMLGSRMGRQLSSLSVEKPPTRSEVSVEGGALHASVTSEPGSRDFQTITLTPASRIGKVRALEFCRPVAGGLVLDAWLGVEGLCPDTYLKFRFDFSWHPKGQHRALFEGVRGAPGAAVLKGDTTVVCRFRIPDAEASRGTGKGRPVTLDLEDALRALRSGRDNTLSSFSIEIGARNGKSISVAIDSLAVRSERPNGENQYAAIDSLSQLYADRYGLRSYVGVEIGKIHTPQSPHMNAYLPRRAQSYGGLCLGYNSSRDQWVRCIHENGGLVSFNHPFGASRNPRSRRDVEADDYEDAPTAEPPRALAAKGPSATEEEFWEVAGPLIEERGLGADVLEVGYLYRGIGSLDDHLRLWDLALANGIRLVAAGTSDSHGGVWGPDMLPNPFATWIWAQSPDADDLIKALRRGHAAFGDPFNFRGNLMFLASDPSEHTAMMGDTLVVTPASAVAGWVRLESVPKDISVVAVAVKMGQGKDLNLTRSEVTGDPYRFELSVDDSCYVRVEVRAKDGTPLVFSNPIYLFPAR